MDFLDTYKTDKIHAAEGVKIELSDDAWIILAYAGASNPNYAAALQAELKPYRKKTRSGTLSPELDRKILARAYAKCIVKDWGGKGFKGKKCTPEIVVDTFVELPEFFLDVQNHATNMEYFAEDYKEEASKNS